MQDLKEWFAEAMDTSWFAAALYLAFVAVAVLQAIFALRQTRSRLAHAIICTFYALCCVIPIYMICLLTFNWYSPWLHSAATASAVPFLTMAFTWLNGFKKPIDRLMKNIQFFAFVSAMYLVIAAYMFVDSSALSPYYPLPYSLFKQVFTVPIMAFTLVGMATAARRLLAEEMATITILVLDSAEDALQVVTDALRTYQPKLKVHGVTSFDEARQLLKSNDVNCLILAGFVQDSFQSTLDFIEEVRADKATTALPIIARCPLQGQRSRMIEAGATCVATDKRLSQQTIELAVAGRKV